MNLFLSRARFGQIVETIVNHADIPLTMEFLKMGGALIPRGKEIDDSDFKFGTVMLRIETSDGVNYELSAISPATDPVWTILTDRIPAGAVPDFPDIVRASRFRNIDISRIGMPCGNRYMSMTPGEPVTSMTAGEFHHRTLLWLGRGNFETISGVRLGLIGAGGLMFPFAQEAVRHGFSNFTIADPDRIEVSNLNRLIGACRDDSGKPKVDVLRREMERAGNDIHVETFDVAFPPNPVKNARMFESFAECDILVCGADNDETRVSAQVFALLLGKPLFDMGSGIFLADETAAVPAVDEMGGQVRAAIPGGPCLGCMGLAPGNSADMSRRELDIERGYIIGTGVTPPAVVTLNSVIASVCLSLVVDYLTRPGGLSTVHLSFDQLGYGFRHIAETRKTNCPICGG